MKEEEKTHVCIGRCTLCKKSATFLITPGSYQRMRERGSIGEARCMDPREPDQKIQLLYDQTNTMVGGCSTGGTIIFESGPSTVENTATLSIPQQKKLHGQIYAGKILDRLRRQYLERSKIRGNKGGISYDQLQTLYQRVLSEGYGE